MSAMFAETFSVGLTVEVLDAPHAEEFLDLLLLRRGTGREDSVDVGDDGLDVGRAVLRHLTADRLEVLPVPFNGLCHDT
jgi:hypothetical protein